MVVKFAKRRLSQESGQSMFEFIFFLPLFLGLFSLTIYIGNAINSSINQQKVARGYLYTRLKGNSYAPPPQPGIHSNWRQFGMYIIGYKEKFREGTQEPLSPCFKVDLPFVRDLNNECDDSYSGSDPETNIITPQVAYGVCATTYVNDQTNSSIVSLPYNGPGQFSNRSACTIVE